MIAYDDAVATARSLIGTPYSELDCINLIKAIIRRSKGGIKNYTDAGTNALWKSYTSSGRYKHLIKRYYDINRAYVLDPHPCAGWLVFKERTTNSGYDVHHVGFFTADGTVIHSSSVKGKVVEEKFTVTSGWNCCAKHRYISSAD